MDNTENRFKIKLPVAENPLAHKLLGNILKVNDAKLVRIERLLSHVTP